MKYKTFARIRIGVIIALVIGVIWGLSQCGGTKKSELANVQAPQQIQQSQQVQATENTMSLSESDRLVLDLLASKVSTTLDSRGENYKRFVKSGTFNVDLRCDFKKGFDRWNRAKVDFGKDKVYDEKWSVTKEGKIRKEVLPGGDESNAVSYEFSGSMWMKRGR